jgi:hypothetical protein
VDSSRFDQLSKVLGSGVTRRIALGALAATALGGTAPLLATREAAAKKRKKKGLGLRKRCGGKSKCKKGLKCGSPTTRHTCDSQTQGVDSWCCIPPGGKCSGECDCCGNNYCSFDNNNQGHCVTNPEG